LFLLLQDDDEAAEAEQAALAAQQVLDLNSEFFILHPFYMVHKDSMI
jgi:hypothetical protein